MLPRNVYRGFTEAAHADAFCRGEILLSTLERCRQLEDDPARHDPDEAHLLYDSGTITDSSPGALSAVEIQRRAKKVGLGIEDCSDFSITGVEGEAFVPDAYLLSLTGDPDVAANKFGGHVVEIRHPRRFMERVARSLADEGCACRCLYDRVTYATREYHASDDPPATIAFIKPERFAEDKELRIIWEPPDVVPPLDRRLVRSTWAGNLCRRIP